MEDDFCRHCHQPIRSVHYLLGDEWMHVDPTASFPTVPKGTAWRHCKLTVAEPKER